MPELLSTDTLIRIDQYATFRESFTLLQSSGAPIDLTGYTWVAQLRANKSDASALASFVVTMTDAANGVVEISLAAAACTTMFAAAVAAGSPGYAFWSLLGTAPAGGDTTRFKGGLAQLAYGESH